MFKFSISIIVGLSLLGTVSAAELRPGRGSSISLGNTQGTLYSVKDGDELTIVATLLPLGSPSPVRITTTLVDGQTVSLTSAGELGQPVARATLVRTGEVVQVTGDGAKAQGLTQ